MLNTSKNLKTGQTHNNMVMQQDKSSQRYITSAKTPLLRFQVQCVGLSEIYWQKWKQKY